MACNKNVEIGDKTQFAIEKSDYKKGDQEVDLWPPSA